METRAPASGFWNRRYEAVDALWSQHPNALLTEFAGGLPPGRALDFGAGEGRNAVWLASRGWRVTALDVSDVALGRAVDRAAREGVDLKCVVADWRAYDPPACSFDLAVISFMHPTPEEEAPMLASVKQALVPGGYVFIVGVDLAEHGRRGPSDSTRLYTPQRLSQALKGFDLVRCESVSYWAESKKRHHRVLDVVAIGRRAATVGSGSAT